MGDAWGGDVSAYRREGEVELGPTTWLYFDSGCAPQRFGTWRGTAISVSAQDMVSQFGSETCGPLCVDSTDPFAIPPPTPVRHSGSAGSRKLTV